MPSPSSAAPVTSLPRQMAVAASAAGAASSFAAGMTKTAEGDGLHRPALPHRPSIKFNSTLTSPPVSAHSSRAASPVGHPMMPFPRSTSATSRRSASPAPDLLSTFSPRSGRKSQHAPRSPAAPRRISLDLVAALPSATVIAARPAPVLGGSGPLSGPEGLRTHAAGGRASRQGSPRAVGSPKGSMLGLGSRSPSPTPRDDVIEGMSASTQSIFERDVEHADPSSLPLTAHDAVDLAIPPVLDEAVSVLTSTEVAAGDLPSIITAAAYDRSALVVESGEEVLSTGGLAGSTASWTTATGAAGTSPVGTPIRAGGYSVDGSLPSHSHSHSRSRPASGTFAPCQYQQFAPSAPASSPTGPMGSVSPPLSASTSEPGGARDLSPGRGGPLAYPGPSPNAPPAARAPDEQGSPVALAASSAAYPAPLNLPAPAGHPLSVGSGETSPPMSVASFPLSSSMSDPSSPRSLSPSGSVRQGSGGAPYPGALGLGGIGGKGADKGGIAMGLALGPSLPPSPSEQAGHSFPLGGAVSGSLTAAASTGPAAAAAAAAAAAGHHRRRLSFLSYADVINAERAEAADREVASTGPGPGGKEFEMGGLLWAALGAGPGPGEDGEAGEEEEEVLRDAQAVEPAGGAGEDRSGQGRS